ncbi:MAG: hypothetical protein ACYC5K_02460 [Saccharofermentanales bacterium]
MTTFATIRLALMFSAEHELPIELGPDAIFIILDKLDSLSAETGMAISSAEASETENKRLREALEIIAGMRFDTESGGQICSIAERALDDALKAADA